MTEASEIQMPSLEQGYWEVSPAWQGEGTPAQTRGGLC